VWMRCDACHELSPIACLDCNIAWSCVPCHVLRTSGSMCCWRHPVASVPVVVCRYYHVFKRINKQLPSLTTLELQYVSPALVRAEVGSTNWPCSCLTRQFLEALGRQATAAQSLSYTWCCLLHTVGPVYRRQTASCQLGAHVTAMLGTNFSEQW
jgi:hypothetical protein